MPQATLYARDLGNPPLIITSDMSVIEVNTAFTGTSPKTYRITLDDVASDSTIAGTDTSAMAILRSALWKPDDLDPRFFREQVTAAATQRVGGVAQVLAARTQDRGRAAHFSLTLPRQRSTLGSGQAAPQEAGVPEQNR